MNLKTTSGTKGQSGKKRHASIKPTCVRCFQRIAEFARKRVHTLSRILLGAAQMELAVAIVTASIAISPWPVLVGLALDGIRGVKRKRALWSHGTARWADQSDLNREGMIGGNGLTIGNSEMIGAFQWLRRIMPLFDRRIPSGTACDFYLRSWKKQPITLNKTPHTLIFGPTGAGKGTSFIIPWLLDVNESAVVLDFKGENATITARHRERMGQKCVLLDPYRVVTQHPDSLNPVQFIDRDSHEAIDDCRSLAEQLVVRNPEAKEPHWDDAAEMFIAAALIGVVRRAENGDRSLQTIRDVLTNPENLPKLINLLGEMGGMFSRIGGSLMFFRDKELSSVGTTVNRHLRFLDTPAIAASTETSSFDPSELRNGRMTVYCILPPEHMRAQSALIRMWIGTLMRSVVKGGLQRG